MTHSDLGETLRQLLGQERYEEAEQLLPDYTHAALQEAPSTGAGFLRAVIRAVKARRAHYVQQLAETTRQRAYLGCECTAPARHASRC